MKIKLPIENIRLSFRCSAGWNNMKEVEAGRFCGSCNRTVYDFSNKSFEEFDKVFRENDGHLCGKFSSDQTVQKAGNPKWKQFLSAFLFLLGNGFMISNSKSQTLNAPPENPLLEGKSDTTEQEVVYGMLNERMPVYKFGGENGLMAFITDNLIYPPECPDGKVYVSFTIDTTGKVRDAKVIRGMRDDADREVLRVVNKLEFIPGQQNGKKVEVLYHLPVHFSLKAGKEKIK